MFNDRQVINNDGINLIKSGRVMFSEVFDQVTSYNYNFSLPNAHAGDTTWLQVNALGRSIGGASSFTVQAGGVSRTIPVPAVGTSETAPYGEYVSAIWVYRFHFAHFRVLLQMTSPRWVSWIIWK